MTETIRILVCDDHELVRKSICGLISTYEGLEIVGEAGDGLEAIKQTGVLKPDVILLDLIMPNLGGLQAIPLLKQAHSGVHILVLTSFSDDEQVFPAIQAGATGYLLKDSSPQQLIQAIHDVAQGQPSLHPKVTQKLMENLQKPASFSDGNETLTGREVEVLEQIAQGKSNNEIARTFQLSERTVRTHVSNILSKLNLENRTRAALYAREKGLIKKDPPG